MKYQIITHGCQMNEHDSERIAWLLESMGYERTESQQDADFLLINTCLVRENAEQKVFGQVGALKHWKKENPNRILAISGCMMQTGPAQEIIHQKYPQVDIVFGTQNIGKLPQLITQHQVSGERIFDTGTMEDALDTDFHRERPFFSYVNIMTGCDNYCTYCIVPYARGHEKSLAWDHILNEVKILGARGVKEIMLLGQNVNSYRDEKGDFPSLLEEIAQIEGIERIRFMSSHPKDLSDRLIEVMARNQKIERHFHLPLQSGSNEVLYQMNRRYTREHFLELVEKLRKAMPDIAITTDIIVGFPGETEEDHALTMDLCHQAEFDSAFTFLYSSRPGTGAARRSDQIPEQVKSRRFQELLDVLYPIFLRKNRASIGDIVTVLPEERSKNDPTRVSGRDEKGRLVHVKGGEELIGQMVSAKITDANSFSLLAEPDIA